MALTAKNANNIKEYAGASSKVAITDHVEEEEEEEEELFEINLEVVNSIPPPQYYWESCYFTATTATNNCNNNNNNVLLANCLLPISDVSNAVPAVAEAAGRDHHHHAFSFWPADSFLVVESAVPGKLVGFPTFNDFGLQQRNKELKQDQ
ncbi:hypothetical protein ACH5RR_004587 [Cinchona calisaya]|uniref:Uncharacterized protein n=1 Tax=Cinchona calisaya TaxID=153742 RepID=A0ABD3AY58_9GENT